MGIVKRFKDFLKGKVKISGESESDRDARVMNETKNRLRKLKDDIDYFFVDFEDMGANVEIQEIYKTDISFKNGSRLTVPKDEDRTLYKKFTGNLRIQIRFPGKNIEDIDPNLQENLKMSLMECNHRLQDIGLPVDTANYEANWSKRNFSHPPGPVKIKDIILMYDDTYGYKVKLFKADTETSTGLMRDKISRLNFLNITIITKEIESEKFKVN